VRACPARACRERRRRRVLGGERRDEGACLGERRRGSKSDGAVARAIEVGDRGEGACSREKEDGEGRGFGLGERAMRSFLLAVRMGNEGEVWHACWASRVGASIGLVGPLARWVGRPFFSKNKIIIIILPNCFPNGLYIYTK
jgi:hypothetical protein